MGKSAPLDLLVLVVVRHVVVTDNVCDRCSWDRGFEHVGLSDEPGAQLPAVACSLHADAVAVDPEVSPYRSADTVENILCFVAVLISENRIRKLLSIAR